MSQNKLRIAVLVSGRGSNLEALANAIAAGKVQAEIAVVLSDKAGVGALDIARRFEIPTLELPFDKSVHQSRSKYFDSLADALDNYRPQLVVLAGFMKVLKPNFIARFADRLINIHPSLLPLFPGLDVQQAALDAGVRESGCTVHVVTKEVDAGPIIGQYSVPVWPGDTAQTLAARILVKEHQLLPLVVDLIAKQKVRIEADGKTVAVQIDPDCLSLLRKSFDD